MQMCKAVLSFPKDSPILPKIEPEEREERAECNQDIGMNLFNCLSHRRPRVRGRLYKQSGKKERNNMLFFNFFTFPKKFMDRAMNDEALSGYP